MKSIIKNYIYKGPILEWQCRAKMRKEGNFKLIESYLPKQGKIVDSCSIVNKEQFTSVAFQEKR